MNRRSLRLELVAGLGMALALPLMGRASVQSVATQTSLNVATSDQTGQTHASVQVNVTGADGQPVAGAIGIYEGSRQLAGVVLNSAGQASTEIALPGGTHNLSAVYTGDTAHQGSVSPVAAVTAQSSSTPGFQLSLAPVTPSSFPVVLKAGAAGTANVMITPVNPSALTSPMFITVSCSGLPNSASCSFSPESLEIVATTPTSCPVGSPASACPPFSSMVIQTQAAGTAGTAGRLNPMFHAGKGRGPVAWAILLPGLLGLGGLAWGVRRHAWLNRLALVALVGLVATLGTTACSPLYYYYNHGPPNTPATPAGTYTITVTGQSSNGITATTQNTTFVLTVQ
ncbi:MAG TPA: Ig-like domain-containing protein [Terracidiphilus sp.]|jgi:hypothetical protein|nr:Ig-like domain-containing protein [Terracidiphilus sp.]